MVRFLNSDGDVMVIANAAKAAFGPDPVQTLPTSASVIFLPEDNNQACESFSIDNASEGLVVVAARRGACTFVHKMQLASDAGASALLVLSDEEEMLIPSADKAELSQISKPIPLVLLPKSGSDLLKQTIETMGKKPIRTEINELVLTDDEERPNAAVELSNTPVIVNGHWLVNCRLVYP